MDKVQMVEETLKEILQGSALPIKSKKLKRLVRRKFPHVKRRHVQQALQSMETKGVVVALERKRYKLGASETTTSLKNHKDTSDLPLAEQIRRRKQESTKTKKSVKFASPQIDLDDEIRRLEEELNADSSESSEDEDELDSKGILSLSELANDRIAALPASCLPASGKRSLKGIDNSNNNNNKKIDSDTGKKRKRSEIQPSPGLKAAVKEVLDGYVARSSLRIPFYCRVCATQYSNEKEFLDHKETEFHKTAVAMERKATYCKLCRKQLTSPAQMKEHLRSRPHKERLETVSRRGPKLRSQPGDSNRQWT